jgi:hypothetical protein
MPFNEQWRCDKIVEKSNEKTVEELIGGLKNALERGDSLEKAARSFYNAGYIPEDITSATNSQSIKEFIKIVGPSQGSSPTTFSEVVPVEEENQERYLANSEVQIQREPTDKKNHLSVQIERSFFSKIKGVFDSASKETANKFQGKDSKESFLPTRKLLSTKSKNQKGSTKKIVIVSLIIIVTLIMILALLAGLFWDKFF